MSAFQKTAVSRSGAVRHGDCFPMVETLEGRRLLSADLATLFAAKLPAVFQPEGKTQVTVRLFNAGDLLAKGPARVELFASADGTLGGGDDVLLVAANKKINIKPSGVMSLKLNVPLATRPPTGTYTLIARVSPAASLSDANSENNIAIAPTPVTVLTPVVDLSAQFTQMPGQPGASGKNSQELAITVTNLGNVTAKGTVGVNWYLSSDTTFDAKDFLIASLPARGVQIAPGQNQLFHTHAPLPANTPLGTFYVLGVVTSAGGIHDTNPANDVAVTSAPVMIINPPPTRRNRDWVEIVNDTYYVVDGGGVVVAPPAVDDGSTGVPPDDGSGYDPGVDTTPPQTDPTTDPTTQPTTDPTTDPSTQPTTDPTTDPTPTTQPDPTPVSDPAPTTQPSSDPDPAPADPTPAPADPPSAPDTNYSSSGGDF